MPNVLAVDEINFHPLVSSPFPVRTCMAWFVAIPMGRQVTRPDNTGICGLYLRPPHQCPDRSRRNFCDSVDSIVRTCTAD